MKYTYPLNGKSLVLAAEKCIGCGICTDVCPHGVIVMIEEGRNARIAQADSCMECGACALNCPVSAITVNRGVGCAAAVIGSMFGIKGECNCGDGSTPCC